MKPVTLKILALSLLLGSAHAGDIYRHTDADGNVIYSDQPSEGASKLEVEPINIDASPKPKPGPALPSNAQATDSQAETYTELAIIAPQDGTTLRNAYEITLTASITPGLRKSHRVRFLDNGKVIAPASRSVSLLVTDLERGSHQFSVETIDENDHVIISSLPISVHVHQASTRQPRPATAPPRVTPGP